jgi:hypothetical protein
LLSRHKRAKEGHMHLVPTATALLLSLIIGLSASLYAAEFLRPDLAPMPGEKMLADWVRPG